MTIFSAALMESDTGWGDPKAAPAQERLKGCSSSFTLGSVSDGPEYSEIILPTQRPNGPTSRAPVVLSILVLEAQTLRGAPDGVEYRFLGSWVFTALSLVQLRS